MKTVLRRTVVLMLAAAALYLALLNAALNLPFTQDLINGIRPEKFHVEWERAWTVRPFRVHVRGLSANGQTRKQQWQFFSPAASASIDLLPLLQRTVKVYDVAARDVEYHQRPRPRPDRDYADVRAFFPPIEGRELETSPPVLPPLKERKPWSFAVEGSRATGSSRVWLYQMQAALVGEARASVNARTRGGPVSVRGGRADLEVESLVLDGDNQVLHGGRIKGTFAVQPFVPRENKGIAKLAFLDLDAEVDTDSESLAFLNPYLQAFEGMRVEGTGSVKGHVRLEKGHPRSGTNLDIAAAELALEMFGYRVAGEGGIRVDVPKGGTETRVVVDFGELEARDAQDGTVFFKGNGFSVEARGAGVVLPEVGEEGGATYLALSAPSLEVPDLGVYQRFLPGEWGFRLHGGEAGLEATAELTPDTFRSRVRLVSDESEAGFRKFRFRSDLDLLVKVDSPSLDSGTFDLRGSHLELKDARFSTDKGRAAPWNASIKVEKGVAKLNMEEFEQSEGVVGGLLERLRKADFRTLAGSASEELKVGGRISDLQWLDLLLKNSYDMSIGGRGEFEADLDVVSGALQKGSRVTIVPRDLAVEFLDYRAAGKGKVELKVTRGGEKPDMVMNVRLDGASFGRKDERKGFVADADLRFRVEAKEVTLDRDGKGQGAAERDVALRLQIPRAKITDMSVYNQYLPEESPLRILGGTASLTADVSMKPKDAKGAVKLVTKKLHARIDDQQVAGKFAADIELAGGIPAEMKFDISGSSLVLSDVVVEGEEKSFEGDRWSARFALTRGEAVWKKPVLLDLEARLEMTDSRPIVAVIANERGKHDWIGKALTVKGIDGAASMKVTKQKIIVPYAFAGSDKIEVGAKGEFAEKASNAALYLRYRKLDAMLRIHNGKRNLEVLQAKKKFDEFWRHPGAESDAAAKGGKKGNPSDRKSSRKKSVDRKDTREKSRRRWWQRAG